MATTEEVRELLILGLGDRPERGDLVRQYLREAGYRSRAATLEQLEQERPLGVVLDVSPST